MSALKFQLTAARRRLGRKPSNSGGGWGASRATAAGRIISTHSRAKAAGKKPVRSLARVGELFQLTAARRRLGTVYEERDRLRIFQLTAARRRLAALNMPTNPNATHFNSQPREGGWQTVQANNLLGADFNSQPREGGWP